MSGDGEEQHREPEGSPPEEDEEMENEMDTEDDKSPAEAVVTGPQEWDEMGVAERLETADVLKKKGNDEFKCGNFEESIATYTKGLGFCPDSEPELRSYLFGNRAAAKMKLDLKTEAVDDCTQALEHNPNYERVLLRRAKLYEELDKLDEALSDYTKFLELDPTNREARLAAQKLPGLINERNEKLKTEMMGKLKELGNMVLRPFGLSTDNFQLQQDPNSGGYSVNFSKSS